MATPPSPMGAVAGSDIISRLASMAGPSQGSQATPDAAGQAVSRQMSELGGADPKMMLKMTQQVKQMTVAMLTRSAFIIPAASRHFAQVQKHLDSAIKELEQAAATQQNVHPPIANQAAMSMPPPGGDQGAIPPAGAAEGAM